jgi:hypothetical protein
VDEAFENLTLSILKVCKWLARVSYVEPSKERTIWDPGPRSVHYWKVICLQAIARPCGSIYYINRVACFDGHILLHGDMHWVHHWYWLGLIMSLPPPPPCIRYMHIKSAGVWLPARVPWCSAGVLTPLGIRK